MSDEDLLIGKNTPEQPTPQGSSGIQVPSDLVNVSVFAVFKEQPADVSEKGEEYVEQVFSISKPRSASDEDVAQFIWMGKIIQQATIRTVGSGGEINFYPLDRFKRFTIKVGSVVGVTL
jgi:hypothetical protein